MDSAALGEFARLLLGTAVARKAAGTVRLAFSGRSQWLRDCQTAVEGLPCIERGGPADIVVTDSSSGPGWHFSLNGRRLSADRHEFFWHAYEGPHAIDLSLHSDQGVEGALRIPPDPGFHWRERHAAAIEAAPALLIVGVMRRAGYDIRPAAAPVNLQPSAPPPGVGPLNWFRCKKLARSLYLRIPGRSPARRWHVGLHTNNGGAIPISGWQLTCGFAQHEAADPFLALHQEQLWLFYEDVLPNSTHGRIAVVPAGSAASKPCVILDRPYHLSYPHVFLHGGDWFMIPESSANSTVDLYRARSFPYEWVHVKTLIQGPRLVDTTPFLHEGRWYFFTTATLPGRAYISLLFVADALDAPWRLHPASPITGDAAIARAAGPITIWGGRIIRPVQDCLVRYGYSISLREIVHLSPSSLEERFVEQILPTWSPGLHGTHTFGSAGPVLTLDGLR